MSIWRIEGAIAGWSPAQLIRYSSGCTARLIGERYRCWCVSGGLNDKVVYACVHKTGGPYVAVDG